jgi:hypothetical protein
MVKFLLLLLITTSCCCLNAKAQCLPSTQATVVTDPSCAGGCRLYLYNWPDNQQINIYDESASPAVLIGAVRAPGTPTDFNNDLLSDTFSCVPCNTPLGVTSVVHNQGGCQIFPIVLAVLLNHFTVVSSPTGNSINWTVNLEQQGVTYAVQRSPDCKTFTDIATLKGLGYGDVAKNYSYVDPVLTQQSFCYRLKAIESNGTITYSSTIATSTDNASGITPEVYPNPLTGNSFRINIPIDQLPALVSIYDVQGQLIYSEEITVPLPTITASLPGGIYALKITGNNGTSTVVKLIKE